MKARTSFTLTLVCMLVAVLTVPSTANAANSKLVDVSTNRVVVKVRSGGVHAATTQTGATLKRAISTDTFVLDVNQSSPDVVLSQLSKRADVEWAERDVVYRAAGQGAKPDVHAAFTPNDPCYLGTCSGATQWGPQKIGASQAWDQSPGSSDFKIAVLDSGIDVDHPDLRGRVSIGANLSSDSTDVDQNGHGTHVAGVIGAAVNNGVGVAGMLINANITSVKILNADGDGTGSGIASALYWCADNGIRIVNLSVQGSYSRTMAQGVAYAQDRGVLIVAAAGNNVAGGSNTPQYPAAFDGVLSVSASSQNDTRLSSADFGNWVDVIAPGEDILSTWPTNLSATNSYVTMTGTSMAAPFVTATAAMVWNQNPYLSAAGIAQRIMDTAKTVPGSGVDFVSGRLDAAAATVPISQGYRMASSDGHVYAFNQSSSGSLAGQRLNKPIVSIASDGTRDGYWLVASDGGVFSYGNAKFYGSTGSLHLNRPVVGASATRSGRGYWFVASDGGIFSFGDASFYGSTASIKLNQPIVTMLMTSTGRGYWLFASDGGVFSFGDACFYGSTGSVRLNQPIVTAARTPSGNGYWLFAADGGVFSFGDASFYGSTGSVRLNQPITASAPAQQGNGYWLFAADGGVFAFGDAHFYGSTGGRVSGRVVSGSN